MPFWKNGRRTFRLRPGCPELGGARFPHLGRSWLAGGGLDRPPGTGPERVPGRLLGLGLGRRPRVRAGWGIPALLGAALAAAIAGVIAAGLAGGLAGVQAQPTQPALPLLESGPVPQDNLARPLSAVSTLMELPPALLHREGRQLVLQRGKRRLLLLEDGLLLALFPVAIGRPGWETPLGSFAVLEKIRNPTWQHPQRPLKIGPSPTNPLGSRWIGFWRDCNLRKPWEGEQPLALPSCATIGFHGTPQRGSVGRAVSHGCVRLYDEDAQRLFEQVEVGTPVTVLP